MRARIRIWLQKMRPRIESMLGWFQIFSRKNVYLFGTKFEHFSGYPRYLFMEYMRAGYSKKIYWIYSNNSELSELMNAGIKAHARKNSIKGIWLAFNSRAFFFSHDVGDVSDVVPPWVKTVNLWHGRPIKCLGFESPVEKGWIVNKQMNGIKLPYERWDYVFAHDIAHADIIKRAWDIPPRKIINYVPPSGVITTVNRPTINGEIKKLTILYAPTFREYRYDYNILKSKKFRIWVKNNNAVVLFRRHPARGRSLESDERFDELEDVTHMHNLPEILNDVDILITDYSSIVFDFIQYKDKSTTLLWDDFENYKSVSDTYYTVDQINADNLFFSADALVEFGLRNPNLKGISPFRFKLNRKANIDDIESLINAG